MSYFRVEKITKGLIWVEVKEANLRLCCGCPPDATKFLNKKKLLEGDGSEAGGPNALLVSDARVQKGRMASFAEFPLMQMLYMQGMIANAGNDRGLPLVVGLKENVDVQLSCFGRGNYGYYSKAEIMDSGVGDADAELYYQIKLWFAEGQIFQPKELCKVLYLDNKVRELVSGVSIQRIGFNYFKIGYKGEYTLVDLNEKESKRELPFALNDSILQWTDFSVIHVGEGNGWEPENPCMGSLLVNNGKVYAVDAGPMFPEIINHVGIDVQDLEGIFLTHIHDDHFAGLPDLLKTSRRLKFFASPLVANTARKKFSALMDLDENAFEVFFDEKKLALGEWNAIDGMEVLPFISPHPVETNAFWFRKKSKSGIKTYAHLADTISFSHLDKIAKKYGSSPDGLKTTLSGYADVKKVDVGGGTIHGEKNDYVADPSPKIVFSHNKLPSRRAGGQEFSGSSFGVQDILIEGEVSEFEKCIFTNVLQRNFPDLDKEACEHLFGKSSKKSVFRGEKIVFDPELLHVLLHGNVALINYENGSPVIVDRYHILGLESFFKEKKFSCQVNTSGISMMTLKKRDFMAEVDQRESWKLYSQKTDIIQKLSRSKLFHDFSSSDVIFSLSRRAGYKDMDPNAKLHSAALNDLYILCEGEGYFSSQNQKVKVKKDDFFGGNLLWSNNYMKYEVIFTKKSSLIKIAYQELQNLPMVMWKIYESCTTMSHLCKTR